MRVMSLILISSVWALAVPTSAATVSVFGVEFDPSNGTTQAWVTSGGYGLPNNGVGLFSGGSDDWVPQSPNVPIDAPVGRSLGTYFLVPTFQPEYDGTEKFGNVGSSVSLGADPKISELSNQGDIDENDRDIIFTRWADGFGLANDDGDDLAIFEKATSEAYAIRVHNWTEGAWTPWYYEIFNETGPFDFATPTEYDLSDLGVGPGQVINGVEITNLNPDDEVVTSKGEFDGMTELGFGEVIFGGSDTGYAPARRSSSAPSGFKAYEEGKFDPDILFVVGLAAGLTEIDDNNMVTSFDFGAAGASTPLRFGPTPAAVPVPPALILMLPAAGLIMSRRRAIGSAVREI